MSEELTKEQREELKKIAAEITDTAKELVDDFVSNPSELTGSVHPTEGKVKGHGIIVGMDSQYLEDKIKEDGEEDINKKS